WPRAGMGRGPAEGAERADVAVGALAAVSGDAAHRARDEDGVVARPAEEGGVQAVRIVDDIVTRPCVQGRLLDPAEVDRFQVWPGGARGPPLDDAADGEVVARGGSLDEQGVLIGARPTVGHSHGPGQVAE